MSKRLSVPLLASGFSVLLLGLLLWSLLLGPVDIPVWQTVLLLIDQVFGSELMGLDHFQTTVVLELRLPRTLLAIIVGCLLAQSGVVMQGLFRNPLADPGIIGVSYGAALGAALAIVGIAPWLGDWAVPLCAFIGGFGIVFFVYGLAHSVSGTSVVILLLAGVAVSALCMAMIGFLSYFASDEDLRALSTWQMGSLAIANRESVWVCGIAMAILIVVYQLQANKLNALMLGEAEARHMGIGVERLKLVLISSTAFGVAIAVCYAGIIGFVGIVVPHVIRLLSGPNNLSLLPLSGLLGAVLMLVADLIARTVAQPAELPVGLVTALIGAPFFMALLIQQRRRWAGA